MEGFSLLLGHLLGDYIFQNDWQAANKTSRTWPCLVHCLFYTMAVFMTCFWFLPWWAYPVIFATHFPIDRWRLARKFMTINHQEAFATGMLAPWSIIVVDNIIHLVVLWVIGMASVAL